MGTTLPGDLIQRLSGCWRPLARARLATPVVLWGGRRSSSGAGTRWSPPPQHVHPHRPRHRRGLRLQPGGDAGPGLFPLPSAATAARRALLRGGRGHHRAGAAGPGARAPGPARTGGAIRALLGLAPDGASHRDPTAASRTCRWSTYGRATACASVPARKCPWTASCWRAERGRRVDGDRRVRPGREAPGDRVIGGTVNGTGSLVMGAERVGAETLLAQIVRMVAEAQRTRAPIQRLADKVAAWFVPAVIVVAVVTFGCGPRSGPPRHGLRDDQSSRRPWPGRARGRPTRRT